MRQLGQRARQMLPNALVDGLEVNLVQAGYPRGLDLPRILGIKITLAAMGAFVFLINGQVLFAVIAASALFFLPDYWVLSVRDQRHAQIQAWKPWGIRSSPRRLRRTDRQPPCLLHTPADTILPP
jgi:hypothetical protein